MLNLLLADQIITILKAQQMGGCNNYGAAKEISVPQNFKGIILTFATWKKTYSNLFDYTEQSDQIIHSTLNVQQTCSVAKNGQQFKIVPGNNDNEDGMVKIIKKNGYFTVKLHENAKKLLSSQIWVVIKSLPNQKYRLKQGDILRIGKQRAKVKQIIFEDNHQQQKPELTTKFKVYENMTKQNSQGYNPDKDKQQPICRVCLEQGEPNNPLIAPCKCSGSAKFIHIKCVQEWFNKITNPRKVNCSIVLRWKPLICQLCSDQLPYKIYFDGVKHYTVNIPRPQKPYIVLNPMGEKTNSKTYHLISFSEKKTLVIGRKKQSDVVLDEDPTISRFHSKIQLLEEGKNKQFYISDKQSKFGTLVLLRKPIDLYNYLSGITIQFGGSIATLIYHSIDHSKSAQQIDGINEEDKNEEKSQSQNQLQNNQQENNADT